MEAVEVCQVYTRTRQELPASPLVIHNPSSVITIQLFNYDCCTETQVSKENPFQKTD